MLPPIDTIDTTDIARQVQSVNYANLLTWVTSFSCAGSDPVVKPFYENVKHSAKPSDEDLASIVRTSFEVAGFTVSSTKIGRGFCTAVIQQPNEDLKLVVGIKTRPALLINGMLFKLEEFEI